MSEIQPEPELRTCPFCGNIFEFSGDIRDKKYVLPFCGHPCHDKFSSYPQETRDRFWDFMFSKEAEKMTYFGIYLETKKLFQ